MSETSRRVLNVRECNPTGTDAITLAREVKAMESQLAAINNERNSLHSRMLLFRDYVCQGCGCAAARSEHLCDDCERVGPSGEWIDPVSDLTREGVACQAAACVSVGMRALCGTKILEGLG